MLKKLFTVGGGNFVNGLGGFLYLIAVAKTLTIEDFGKYALLVFTFGLFSKLTEFGTTSSFVTQSIKLNQDHKASLLVLKLILTFLISLISLPFLYYYKMSTLTISTVFLIGLFSYALNDYLFAIFQLNEDFFKTTLVNSLPAIVKATASCLLLSGFFKVGLSGALSIYFMSLLSSLLIAPFAKTGVLKKLSLKEGIVNLVKYGFGAGISQTLNLSTPAINSNLIKLSSTFSDVGIFSLAEKISTIFSLLSLSIFTILLPHKAKEVKKTGKYNFNQIGFFSLLTLFSITIMLLLSKPVMLFVFENKYEEYLPVLYIMTISAGIMAITTFMDNFFIIFEENKTLLQIKSARILTLVVLSVFLIKSYGIMGASYSNLISSGISFLITAYAIKKINGKKLNPY